MSLIYPINRTNYHTMRWVALGISLRIWSLCAI